MAALAPPPNASGVPLPANPANPASLVDITNARLYSDQLLATKLAGIPNPVVDTEIGAAEAYKTAVVFSHNPGGNIAPPWLANMNAAVQQTAVQLNQVAAQLNQVVAQLNQVTGDVAYLRQRADELPFILANSQRGPHGRLFNPTIVVNGWAPLLDMPNPRTRDELLQFTVQQCIVSSANLGLPLLPVQTPVLERRRQIAVKIGVSID